MQKVKLFLSGALIFSLSNAASLESFVPFASKENINKKKDAIVREIKIGKMLKYGMAGAAAFSTVYLAYVLLLNKGEVSGANILNNKDLTDKVLRLEEKFKDKYEAKIFSRGWFKKIGKTAFTSFVSSVVGSVGFKLFDKFYTKYHCFENLDTFMNVRLNSIVFLDNVLYNAQVFDFYLEEAPSDLPKAKDMFLVALSNLIPAIENIIAFMEYKLDYFSTHSYKLLQEDLLIPQYLFDYTNEYCAKINKLLDNNSDDSYLCSMTVNFKNDVLRFIGNFQGLEGRIAWIS